VFVYLEGWLVSLEYFDLFGWLFCVFFLFGLLFFVDFFVV